MKLSNFVVCNVDMGSVAMGVASASVNARSNVYGICGLGMNCGGGGGECGLGMNCSGGGGKCGLGMNCSGW